MDISTKVSRRGFLALGAGAASALALAACSPSGEGSPEPAAAGGEFDRVIGMAPQEAWEELAGEGWCPSFVSWPTDGEPGTVAMAERREVADPASLDIMDYPDAEGATHPELAGTEWRGAVTLGVTGMAQIPPGLTTATPRGHALEQLKEAGFTDVTVLEEGDVEPGATRVLACSPAPAAWALPGDEVTLTVTSDTEMPDVIGLSPTEATSALLRASLVADPEVCDNAGYAGRSPVAVSASAEAGEALRVGDTVHVEYSEPVGEE